MGLEQEPWWDDLVAKKDTHSLRELAEEFGVSAGAISLALKKTNTSKVPQGGSDMSDDTDTPASRPGSKDHLIEPLLDQLGQVSDAEVARKAGVSVRTVASYRARNQIGGYKGRGAPGKKRRRKSKIDPYYEMLGKVPDRVIAEKAGVTLNAVRNYRANRGIISSRQRTKEMREQGLTEEQMDRKLAAARSENASTTERTATQPEIAETPALRTPVPAAAPAAPAAPAVPAAPAAPAPAPLPPPPVGGVTYAWSIAFEGGREGVVSARDASDAAVKGGRYGVVTGLSRLGQMIA